MKRFLDERGIGFHPQHKLSSVDPGKKEIAFENGQKADFDLLVAVPPHRSPEVVRKIADKIRKIAAAEKGPEQFFFAGDPVARDTFGTEMFRQMAYFSPLAGMVMMVALYVMFRSATLVIANMGVAMISILWAMGFFIGLLVGFGTLVVLLMSFTLVPALIENASLRYLLGYERELWTDFSVRAQYYLEQMLEYGDYKASLPPGAPEKKEVRHLLFLRLTQLLRYQTVELSLVGFYGPSDEDGMVNPQVSCKITDRLSVALGANVFFGKKDFTQFGQLEKDDNLYLRLRASY